LDIELAKNAVKGLSQREKGVVRVGMLPCIGNVLSMPMIELQSKRYPGIQLDISTGPSYAVKSWLEDGKVDIALMYEQMEFNKNATIYPLINESLYLVTGTKNIASDHQALFEQGTVSFWELNEIELLIPSVNDALGKLIHDYEVKTGVALRHNKTYSGQLMTALRQVIEGYAMMILPSSAVFHLERQGVVRSAKIVEPEIRRNACAIVDSTHSLDANVLSTFKVVKSAVNKVQSDQQWRGECLC
jgi:DNA-binding transcriptional LysR family regulator